MFHRVLQGFVRFSWFCYVLRTSGDFFRVRVLVESERLQQNESKTLCFTVFFDH